MVDDRCDRTGKYCWWLCIGFETRQLKQLKQNSTSTNMDNIKYLDEVHFVSNEMDKRTGVGL